MRKIPLVQKENAAQTVRVKGRDTGTPQWDKLERLENGKWHDFVPPIPTNAPDTMKTT